MCLFVRASAHFPSTLSPFRSRARRVQIPPPRPTSSSALGPDALGVRDGRKSTERLMFGRTCRRYLGFMHESAPDAFLSALSARDFGRFADCLAPDAQARMLLPPGPEVRSGREEIARRFEGWFSRASDFEVLDSHRVQVGLRNRLSWRFRMSRGGQPREIIEQVAFVKAGPGGIYEIDLLCSGFMREEEGLASCAVDSATTRGAR